MALFTSAFWHPKVKQRVASGSAVAVGIVLYPPRKTEEKYGYSLFRNVSLLAPDRATFKIDDFDEFRKPFRHLLHRRQNKIFSVLSEIVDAADGKDVILLCYDRVDGEDNWCHREFVAEWLEGHKIDCKEL
jgi:uncharacterized protein YeaO (DUF488 family)